MILDRASIHTGCRDETTCGVEASRATSDDGTPSGGRPCASTLEGECLEKVHSLGARTVGDNTEVREPEESKERSGSASDPGYILVAPSALESAYFSALRKKQLVDGKTVPNPP